MIEQKASPTTVLLNNTKTYRDCWMDGDMLVIRQISFNPDGTEGVVTKVLRISPEEWDKLQKVRHETHSQI